MNHTPGPWKKHYDGSRGIVVICEGAELYPTGGLYDEYGVVKDGIVCHLDGADKLTGEHESANARLMAASPQLLEALKEIAKGEGVFSLDPLTFANNTIENMKEIAQAAIEAAEGES